MLAFKACLPLGTQTLKNQPQFSDDDPSDVTIGFTRGTADLVSPSDDPSVAISIEGKFVGTASEGPQGTVGIWTLRDCGDIQIGTGDRVHRAFGAELEPKHGDPSGRGQSLVGLLLGFSLSLEPAPPAALMQLGRIPSQNLRGTGPWPVSEKNLV